VKNNFHGILPSLQISANKKRSWLEKRGMVMSPGQATGELPLVSLQDPRFACAVTVFARKLFLALYYLHTGRVLPHEGGARFRWWTNANDLSILSTAEVQSMLRTVPDLKRAKTTLHDQFSYKFAFAGDNPNLAAFLVSFNQSFVMLAMVGVPVGALPAGDSRVIEVRPYSWA
jgi:hypothetical protein